MLFQKFARSPSMLGPNPAEAVAAFKLVDTPALNRLERLRMTPSSGQSMSYKPIPKRDAACRVAAMAPPIFILEEYVSCFDGQLKSSVPILAAKPTKSTMGSCSITRSGDLSCVKAVVATNDEKKACTVELTASFRDAGITKSSTMVEQLTWLKAQEVSSAQLSTLSDNCSRDAEDRHQEVQEILAHGQIVDATKLPVCNPKHPMWKLKLEHKGRSINALFKPVVDNHDDGFHRVPMEVVAYRLNRLLGLDFVPPAVFRPACHVDWHHWKDGGIFMYWCENAQALEKAAASEWGVDKLALLADARVLDILIQNFDRHHGNFLMGEHWSCGDSVGTAGWRGQRRPVFIDHSAGMREQTIVVPSDDNAFGTGPMRRVSMNTYLKLRLLDSKALRRECGNFLSKAEMAAIMWRRDELVEHFDDLIERHGIDQVMIAN